MILGPSGSIATAALPTLGAVLRSMTSVVTGSLAAASLITASGWEREPALVSVSWRAGAQLGRWACEGERRAGLTGVGDLGPDVGPADLKDDSSLACPAVAIESVSRRQL